MSSENGTSPTNHDPDRQDAALLAALLVRVIEQEEQGGLSRRNAVLAAGSELGISPAMILRCAGEVNA